jgi:hypothetical protein
MKRILLICMVLLPISVAASQTVIINQPGGGQTVCIVQGGYVTCY